MIGIKSRKVRRLKTESLCTYGMILNLINIIKKGIKSIYRLDLKIVIVGAGS